MNFGIFLITIASGLVGTVAMTIVMYLYANLTKTNTKVVHIFGAMLTGNTGLTINQKVKILTTGTIAHVFVGVLFSFSYFLLWNWGVFSISFFDSLIIGAISGILAIVVWKSYFKAHRKPPKVYLRHYFTALFISHVVFGLVTVYVFSIIAISPQFWFELEK